MNLPIEKKWFDSKLNWGYIFKIVGFMAGVAWFSNQWINSINRNQSDLVGGQTAIISKMDSMGKTFDEHLATEAGEMNSKFDQAKDERINLSQRITTLETERNESIKDEAALTAEVAGLKEKSDETYEAVNQMRNMLQSYSVPNYALRPRGN